MTGLAVTRRLVLLVGLVASTMVLPGVGHRPALAQATGLSGSAYGYFASVSLFGGPAVDSGPAPVVTLPAGGSPEPLTVSDPDGETAQYGPAVIVQTTAMTVSTEGVAGADGTVTSSALVEFNADQDEQPDPFNADDVSATCTATGSGFTGSATLNNASLVLSTDPATQEPVETVDLPADPEPNTAFEGTIDHVGDRFRVVLNEQIEEGGALTVNAVHIYLLGNIAIGDAIIGHSVCGVNAVVTDQPAATPTTEAASGAVTTATSQPEEAAVDSEDGSSGGGALLIGGLVIGGLLVLGLVYKAVTGRRTDG